MVYHKFSSGLLICTNQAFQTSAAGELTWTYPHAFAYPASPARPVVSGTISSVTGQSSTLHVGGIAGAGGFSTEVNVWAKRNDTNDFVTKSAGLTAIGRWK